MRGFTLVEVLVVLALIGIALAVAAPTVASLRDGGRAEAGAREVASRFQAQRMAGVATRRFRGLAFAQDDRGWAWREVEDGNGNGLRTAEVAGGVDRTLSGPWRLEDRVGQVRLGFPPVGAPFPRIPPDAGTIPTGDPVQFGSSDIVSFSPLGNSSSGTLYLTDGRAGLCAVVLFGPSARVRVWRYDPVARRWSL